MKKRCEWSTNNDLMIKYHDVEWGLPLYDDRKLFEFLVLEAFQAGLSWNTVINKRENFRKAFDNFNALKIAKYDEKKIVKLLSDTSIIRNRLKIATKVENAKQFMSVQKPIQNSWKSLRQIPAKTKDSDKMSVELKKRGFKFVGSTICYAFMQATGMVNDHLTYCFRYKEVQNRF